MKDEQKDRTTQETGTIRHSGIQQMPEPYFSQRRIKTDNALTKQLPVDAGSRLE
jgi:hypothetical protein